ncbi:MAG: hypothetical protein JWM77_1543 [Rhodospirillales bacterium]|nr:hypothetical protein [Rhodospirillales bacterium]
MQTVRHALRIAALLVAASLSAFPADASLIAVDSSFGPRTIVLDTATGLNWLTPRVSQNMSTDAVIAAMAAGQPFEGWRYPSLSEFCGLTTDAGLSPPCWGMSPDPTNLLVFIDLFGPTVPAPNIIIGLFAPEPENQIIRGAIFYGDQLGMDVQGVFFPRAGFANEGTFLVQNAIPEPADLLLLATALALLALARRAAREA